MKFLIFAMYDAAKTTEVAAASDKAWSSPPPGIKKLAFYTCLGMPFFGLPPNTLVAISVNEVESAEALAMVTYPLALAGATVHSVPVLDIPVGGSAGVEKKLRG